MSKGQLKNYIKKSDRSGLYSYRRRIPSKYKDSFTKSDGKLRGLEWKEALKTKSISVALRRAVEINNRFEQTKAYAKKCVEEETATIAPSEQQRLMRTAEFFRREGVHPDQAPSILASDEEKKEWLKKRDKFRAKWFQYRDEFGVEINGVGPDEHYTTNETYDELEAGVQFLEGDRKAIKSRLRVTWDVAVDEYLLGKARLSETPNLYLKEKEAKRIERVAHSFRISIGGGDRYLVDISRQDARLWVSSEEKRRLGAGYSLATVGRETSTLSAIFSRAIAEYSSTDRELQSNGNPFSRLRGELEKIDEHHVRTGEREAISSRAWTSDELSCLKARLLKMNDQASLCTKLAMFTGARLKDVAGLMIDELRLNSDNNSYIDFKDNAFRKISKDSIERRFPLYGEILKDLKDYVSKRDFTLDKKLTPNYAKNNNSSNQLSDLLNKKHIDTFSKDPSLIMHGMRDTLQAKFDAAQFANKVSGYLIGWRNQETIGMQSNYNRQGYPHKDMLETLRKAHSITEWATQRD